MSVSEVAIRASALSKCYKIYARPQDRLKQSIAARLDRLLGRGGSQFYREFWALSNIDFEVAQGRTVGIIGRNGSGKSTLLQILCGTLSPTSGSVEISGRVAAMLELGSGFNPDFTGRENVYMNGMVLGLSRDQVAERFERIAAFADIGDFMEQPVRTYSSGMLVRLAFAVMAHVDADILVIDEALAVGDAVFGQKCMRFLRRFREKGTVLFVSHDTSSIIGLCSEAIWLEEGRIRMRGPAKDVAEAYTQYCALESMGEAFVASEHAALAADERVESKADAVDQETRIDFFDNIAHSEGWTTDHARIREVVLSRRDGRTDMSFSGGERVVLTVNAQVHVGLSSPIIGFFVKDRLGQSLFGHNTWDPEKIVPVRAGESVQARFSYALPMLPDGDYSMTVAIADGDLQDHVQHHWLHDALILSVRSTKPRYGLVGIPFESIELNVQN